MKRGVAGHPRILHNLTRKYEILPIIVYIAKNENRTESIRIELISRGTASLLIHVVFAR